MALGDKIHPHSSVHKHTYSKEATGKPVRRFHLINYRKSSAHFFFFFFLLCTGNLVGRSCHDLSLVRAKIFGVDNITLRTFIYLHNSKLPSIKYLNNQRSHIVYNVKLNAHKTVGSRAKLF